jgi:ATP-dependent DNA helicase RecG
LPAPLDLEAPNLKTITITDAEFEEIADRDESHFFDIKQQGVSGKSIQKIGVAFSNADGGELIIGIKDKKTGEPLSARWEGIADIEQLNGHLQALFDVKPPLDLRYEFLKREKASGYALRVLFEKGTQVSTTSDGTIYLRQGAQFPVRDPERMQQLSFAKGASSFEDVVLSELPAEEVVDSTELGTFLRDYSPRTDPLEFALNQNLLDFKSWQPRVAGALLFHPSPSAVVPRKCAIKITRMRREKKTPKETILRRKSRSKDLVIG